MLAITSPSQDAPARWVAKLGPSRHHVRRLGPPAILAPHRLPDSVCIDLATCFCAAKLSSGSWWIVGVSSMIAMDLLAGIVRRRADRISDRKLRGRGRRMGTKRLPRQALSDELSALADEALNTVEDVALHGSRLGPWLPQVFGSAPAEADNTKDAMAGRPRVVILGTGWAGHALAKVIDTGVSDVCVVSPRNYFIFTPMLAAASVGTVEYRSILEHIRSSNPKLRFYQSLCEGIDVERHEVVVRPTGGGSDGASFSLPYDTLVIAVGVQPSSRGVPGVLEHCLFLKSIEDARRIRKTVTEKFETADLPTTSLAERQRLLTVVVVGGGPTGCEFCGELSDFVRNDLRRFYPDLAQNVRIILVQRGDRLLPMFDPELQQIARETLQSQGIEIRTGCQVGEVRKDALTIVQRSDSSEEVMPYGVCVWAAGQSSVDVINTLRSQLTEQGQDTNPDVKVDPSRLLVDEWLRVKGVPDGSVVALGDCAQILQSPLPQTAQVAAQQGAYAARLLNRRYTLDASGPPRLVSDADNEEGLQSAANRFWDVVRLRGQLEAPKFRFLNLGQLAYLGDEKALAEIGLGSVSISQAGGRAAFLLWRSVYLVKQVSFRNRVLVLFDWVKSRIFGRDLTRF